ncbi:MAG: YceD family protein [Pyrinomonadaceae bacterium]
MIIDLANVGLTPKKVELKLDSSEIDLEGEYATLTGEARFSGETQRIDSKAHIRGNIEANFSLDCTRCLEPVAKHIDVLFDDVFVDSAEETQTSETEVGFEGLNESLVQDGKIDIAEVVREQLLLALPDQVFCSDDCKGLCPKCGANRNLIDCKCADDEIDPRWAALKELQ